jgi:23S rRNA (uracil1939-C5)-methyltransferase
MFAQGVDIVLLHAGKYDTRAFLWSIEVMESSMCPYHSICSGCSQWEIPYDQQLSQKKLHFLSHLTKLQIDFTNVLVHSIQPKQLRDRLDFVIEDGRFGLFSKQQAQIVDLPECWQLTPALQDFLSDFRKISWPIKKGSFRLRVNPEGKRGAWLDFSNLDIKFLMEEKKTLHALLEIAWVEIGQRRKPYLNGKLSKEPVLQYWTRTFSGATEIQLLSTVGNFSQVGDQANQLIVKRIEFLANQVEAKNFLEYGAGTGNLTFPILGNQERTVDIIETDNLALNGLLATAEKMGFADRISVQLSLEKIDFSKIQLAVVNPPRSGALDLFQHLQKSSIHPDALIYMSCYPESYFRDAELFMKMGYRLKNAELVDQFPQSEHYEILSLWKK